MNLFIFFALPLAIILLSIVFQKILKCPILVAITVFAIGLIVSFVAFSSTLAEALIATIIYSIIAFVTASIVKIICECIQRFRRCSSSCICNNVEDDNCGCNNDENNNCGCDNNSNNNAIPASNDIAIRANFAPCNNNNGRTGSIRGCYRRM